MADGRRPHSQMFERLNTFDKTKRKKPFYNLLSIHCYWCVNLRTFALHLFFLFFFFHFNSILFLHCSNCDHLRVDAQ